MPDAETAPKHKFHIDQIVLSKSGREYRIWRLRCDAHPKLKGEIGYDAFGRRNGQDFGPIRLMRESALAAQVPA